MAKVDPALDEWTTTDILLGRLLEAWTESEVVPRPSKTSTTTTDARREAPVVSLREAMGFVNASPDEFAEKYAPPTR